MSNTGHRRALIAREPTKLTQVTPPFVISINSTMPLPSATLRVSASAADPLLLRTARGERVERTPVWLMRQAGRYMADFRKFSDKIPFRERSETASIAVELSLQPWNAFQPDGVIMCVSNYE